MLIATPYGIVASVSSSKLQSADAKARWLTYIGHNNNPFALVSLNLVCQLYNAIPRDTGVYLCFIHCKHVCGQRTDETVAYQVVSSQWFHYRTSYTAWMYTTAI